MVATLPHPFSFPQKTSRGEKTCSNRFVLGGLGVLVTFFRRAYDFDLEFYY